MYSAHAHWTVGKTAALATEHRLKGSNKIINSFSFSIHFFVSSFNTYLIFLSYLYSSILIVAKFGIETLKRFMHDYHCMEHRINFIMHILIRKVKKKKEGKKKCIWIGDGNWLDKFRLLFLHIFIIALCVLLYGQKCFLCRYLQIYIFETVSPRPSDPPRILLLRTRAAVRFGILCRYSVSILNSLSLIQLFSQAFFFSLRLKDLRNLYQSFMD